MGLGAQCCDSASVGFAPKVGTAGEDSSTASELAVESAAWKAWDDGDGPVCVVNWEDI